MPTLLASCWICEGTSRCRAVTWQGVLLVARRALSIAWLLLSIGALLPIRIVLLRIRVLRLTGLLVVLWRGRGVLVGSLL